MKGNIILNINEQKNFMNTLLTFFKCTQLFVLLVFLSSCSTSRLTIEEQEKVWTTMYLETNETSCPIYFNAIIVEENNPESCSNQKTVSLLNGGFTPGSCLRLYLTRISRDSLFIGNVIADNNGKLILAGKNPQKIEDQYFLLEDHMLGEESAYTLIPYDGKAFITTSILPKPLITEGTDGVKLKMRLASQEGDYFLLHASGLFPGEKVNIVSTSDNKINQALNADANGQLQHLIRPIVLGCRGGFASYELIRENGEKLKMSYPWGLEIIKTASKQS